MITHYKCKNIDCKLHGIEVPDNRCLRSPNGKGRVYSECDSKMIAAQTMSTSPVPRESPRTPSRSIGGGTSSRPAKNRTKKRVSARPSGSR